MTVYGRFADYELYFVTVCVSGVLNSPRTCLHAVLSLLDKDVDTRNGPSCLQTTPKLAELSYRLVYCMCANRDTSTPTLRYLRTTRDFLYRHLQHAPFTQLNGAL